MKFVALLAAGFAAVSAPASAQYILRPPAPIELPSAQDATEIVEAMGLRPIGVAMRNGPFYVQSARDDLGRVLRVTIDARRSQVVNVVSGVPRALYGPDAGYVPQVPLHRGPAAYRGQDFDIAPPGSVMGARMPPGGIAPYAVTAPKPSAKSAAVAPSQPPVPRKRPVSAPQQAAGTVEPVAATPQASPAAIEKPASASPPPAPEKPANALPPVSPLE